MLSARVTARVRSLLDQVATSAPGPGRTADSVSFAAKLRDQLDAATAATDATRSPVSGTAADTEGVDALWKRMQVVQAARYGQGDALMQQFDARDEARRTRSSNSMPWF